MKVPTLRRILRLMTPSRNRGVALVITLAMVVLLTVIVIAFFARSMLNRQIETSGAGREAADVLALSALEALTGELLNEMRAASTVETTNSVSLFRPASDGAVRPSRVVAAPFVGATNAKTLVKQSLPAAALFPSNAPYDTTSANRVFPAASGVSTTNVSRDGRLISTNRWNAPRLLSNGFDPAGAPYWIYVARSGIASDQTITPAWSDYAAGNSNAIVGRVAFNIYDTGGLLNANVAGYPASLTPEQARRLKGSQAGADLGRLPGVTAAAMDALAAFRNPQAAGNAEAYTNYVLSGGVPAGFRSHQISLPDSTTVTNSFFTSRQDLIRYAEAQNPALTNALPYLTHASSALNAPSWKPEYDAEDKEGGASLNEFQYRSRATNTASLNRDVLTVRFPADATITRYKQDGTALSPKTVKAGEPLIQRRFPLKRLAWIGPDGPQNGATDDAIRACFGLRWSGGVWQYVGPSGGVKSQIKTLKEVADESREPNFFELLQAAILDGSLGVSTKIKTKTDSPTIPISASVVDETKKSTFQALRIGANLIDQYDADSYPTVIEYDADGVRWQAAGVENLPYLESVVPLAGPKPGDENNNLVVYLLPKLWNPHRGSASSPPRIRLVIAGDLSARNFWGKLLEDGNADGYPKATNDPKVALLTLSGIQASAELSGAADFSESRYPVTSDFASGLTDSAAGICWAPLPTDLGGAYAGFRFPDFHIDPTKVEKSGSVDPRKVLVRIGNDRALYSFANIFLEFRTPSGQWIPYAFFYGNNEMGTWVATNNMNGGGNFWENEDGDKNKGVYTPKGWPPETVLGETLVKSDPRTSRIAHMMMGGMVGMEMNPQLSLWSRNAPTAGQVGNTKNLNRSRNGYGGYVYTDGSTARWPQSIISGVGNKASDVAAGFYGGTKFFGDFYYPAWLSRNFGPNEVTGASNSGGQSSARPSTYVDVDGVRRIADSGRYKNELPSGNQAPTVGNPYWRQEDKPVILNRPFESMAEMGYAFRDLPWKSLDFFSENSADAGLLDFFTLTDADADIVADRINLASAPAEVLAALLTGMGLDAADSASAALSGIDAQKISQKLTAANVVLENPAGLATRLVGPLDGDHVNPGTSSLLADTDFPSEDAARIKAYREAVVRALGGTSDTRNWNLMVDLIAQWGRFPSGATNAADFIVFGEKRYWLHLSIDRYTGQILSRQLEAVVE